jgi:Uma2 family endonuclease
MATELRFTVADLANFPDDGQRYEVIDGELYVSTAPHHEHQHVIHRIASALGMWDPEERHGYAVPGVGVIFSADTGVIPDLVWVQADKLTAVFSDAAGERDGKLHAAPDLVVEVLSPGAVQEQRDRDTKRTLYSRRGVREYWIVDRARRTVEVHRRTSAVLALEATLTDEDTLTSPLLPGFALPVRQIFSLPPALSE